MRKGEAVSWAAASSWMGMRCPHADNGAPLGKEDTKVAMSNATSTCRAWPVGCILFSVVVFRGVFRGT